MQALERKNKLDFLKEAYVLFKKWTKYLIHPRFTARKKCTIANKKIQVKPYQFDKI